MSGKSIYSFGEESPLKFEISDKLAKNYNSATEKFLKAQQRFNQKFGRKWNPDTDPISLGFTRKEKWAWNEFAKVLKNSVENDGRYYPNDVMDDFLVKNTVLAVAVASRKMEVVISLAVVGGVLYGLLNRRKVPL